MSDLTASLSAAFAAEFGEPLTVDCGVCGGPGAEHTGRGHSAHARCINEGPPRADRDDDALALYAAVGAAVATLLPDGAS